MDLWPKMGHLHKAINSNHHAAFNSNFISGNVAWLYIYFIRVCLTLTGLCGRNFLHRVVWNIAGCTTFTSHIEPNTRSIRNEIKHGWCWVREVHTGLCVFVVPLRIYFSVPSQPYFLHSRTALSQYTIIMSVNIYLFRCLCLWFGNDRSQKKNCAFILFDLVLGLPTLSGAALIKWQFPASIVLYTIWYYLHRDGYIDLRQKTKQIARRPQKQKKRRRRNFNYILFINTYMQEWKNSRHERQIQIKTNFQRLGSHLVGETR